MKWLSFALLISASLQGVAQLESPSRFAVTAHQVAFALMQQGLVVSDNQISLPTRISSAAEEPILKVDSIEALRGDLKRSDNPDDLRVRFKVKLACHSSHICVPFYAIVGSPVSTISSVATALDIMNVTHPIAPPISMHAGSSATLIVDTGGMHIQVPVISLQNGAIGARIHVISPDHKQTYSATIVSATLLMGSL